MIPDEFSIRKLESSASDCVSSDPHGAGKFACLEGCTMTTTLKSLSQAWLDPGAPRFLLVSFAMMSLPQATCSPPAPLLQAPRSPRNGSS